MLRPELRPRRRLREYSMWTFVAPVALIVSVVIVVSVISGAMRRDHTATTHKTTTSPTTTAALVSKAGKKAYYRVHQGDTLATIADRLNIDVDTLYRLNPNVDEFNLQPGQRLRVQ
jgi:LysM repeat protein